MPDPMPPASTSVASIDPAAGKAPDAAAPIVLPLIGSGPTGPGTPLPATGTVIPTPGSNQPDLVVKIVSPILAVLIRFVNNWLGSTLGILTGGGLTHVITAPDFLHLFEKSAGLALAGAAILLGKDLLTVLTGLEQKFPLATGSV